MKKTRMDNDLYQVHGSSQGLTRREFVARGGAAVAWSWLMLPSLAALLSRQVMASSTGAACQAFPPSSRIPFFALDLVGGGNMVGSNIMVGGRNGQQDLFTSYVSLGLPDSLHPRGRISNEFGLQFYSDSGFLRGMLAATSLETRRHVDGMVFCNASNDDTENNPHNPTFWIAKSGTRGDLGALIGSRTSESGGNSVMPTTSFDLALRPAVVRNPTEAMALVQTGRLEQALGRPGAEKVLGAMRRMSESALHRFQSQDLSAQLRDLTACGYLKANRLSGADFDPASLSYENDADIRSIFTPPAGADSLARSAIIRAASITKLVLDGHCGAATIESPGHDYHINERGLGETRDEQAGLMIGMILESAARKGKDAMIYVYTDGSVTTTGEVDPAPAGRGKCVWVSDGGDHSASMILVYRANRSRIDTPILTSTSRRQIGWYKQEASGKLSVDRSANIVANSVTDLAKAVVANYLALHGEEGRLPQIVGDNPFGGNLDKYIGFKKI